LSTGNPFGPVVLRLFDWRLSTPRGRVAVQRAFVALMGFVAWALARARARVKCSTKLDALGVVSPQSIGVLLGTLLWYSWF